MRWLPPLLPSRLGKDGSGIRLLKHSNPLAIYVQEQLDSSLFPGQQRGYP